MQNIPSKIPIYHGLTNTLNNELIQEKENQV